MGPQDHVRFTRTSAKNQQATRHEPRFSKTAETNFHPDWVRNNVHPTHTELKANGQPLAAE